MKTEELEFAADEARVKFGFEGQLVLDGMTIIVKMKNLGMIRNYRRVPDEEMPYDEATFDAIDRILIVPERTFTAMNRGEPRAMMTIAEEVGHITLGHTGIRHRSNNNPADPRPIRKK